MDTGAGGRWILAAGWRWWGLVERWRCRKLELARWVGEKRGSERTGTNFWAARGATVRSCYWCFPAASFLRVLTSTRCPDSNRATQPSREASRPLRPCRIGVYSSGCPCARRRSRIFSLHSLRDPNSRPNMHLTPFPSHPNTIDPCWRPLHAATSAHFSAHSRGPGRLPG